MQSDGVVPCHAVPDGAEHIRPFTVLFVCSDNVRLSPIAERLARGYFEHALKAGASAVVVRSAGTAAVTGSPMNEEAQSALLRLGYPPRAFSACLLNAATVMSVDAVLTMSLEQRSEVLTLEPRALARTFTLREAADLVRLVGPCALRGASFGERAAEVVGQMARVRSRRGRELATDIQDPLGLSPEAYHSTAAALSALLRRWITTLVMIAGSGADEPPDDQQLSEESPRASGLR